MLALLQRVQEARVVVNDKIVGQIGSGLLVLVCAEKNDTELQADKLLEKIIKLRIFSDENGKMNLSVQDVQGSLLLVSQFTLAADLKSGTRPGFSQAASPAEGRRLYDYFVAQTTAKYQKVQCGIFGADMKVHLINDGPVTIPLRIAPVVPKDC